MKLYVRMENGSVRSYDGSEEQILKHMDEQDGHGQFITREEFDAHVAADEARIEQAQALARAEMAKA